MKKLFATILTFLACGAAYALPVGNPSDASLLCDGLLREGHCGDLCDPCLTWCDAFSLRAGFWGDYVFNRHLKVEKANHDKIEHTRINTNAAVVTANIWDRLDLFTTLGATNLAIDTNAFTFGVGEANGARLNLETKTNFSWSLGARGTIWECGCTNLGAEFQYFSVNNSVNRVTLASLSSVYPTDVSAKYHEWQVGLGLSHRINIFVPYIAVKWSRAKVNFDHEILFLTPETAVALYNLENHRHWGCAIGVSLVDCEKASLTVEGRFGDECALHVNGQLRF